MSILAEKAGLRSPATPLSNESSTSPSSPTIGGPSSLRNAKVSGSDLEVDTRSHHSDFSGGGAGGASIPPPYSTPSSASIPNPRIGREREIAARQNMRFPGLPNLDYKIYSPPLFELSPDCVTLQSKAPYLSANVTALVNTIRQQAKVPPKPQVQVVGSRGRTIDFNIKLNLMHLLVAEDEEKRMDYMRCVYPGEMALRGGTKPEVALNPDLAHEGEVQSEIEAWARRFIEDSAPRKTFTLERQVANLDTAWIEGQLRTLISSTKYKGHVTITFPVTHAKIMVSNPDKVNKYFTSIGSFLLGRKQYEVVKSIWPFASAANGESDRVCIVQTEEMWWREWKDPIKYCIATKRNGWVTNEDKLEAIMEGKGKGLSIVDWGPDYD